MYQSTVLYISAVTSGVGVYHHLLGPCNTSRHLPANVPWNTNTMTSIIHEYCLVFNKKGTTFFEEMFIDNSVQVCIKGRMWPNLVDSDRCNMGHSEMQVPHSKIP